MQNANQYTMNNMDNVTMLQINEIHSTYPIWQKLHPGKY